MPIYLFMSLDTHLALNMISSLMMTMLGTRLKDSALITPLAQMLVDTWTTMSSTFSENGLCAALKIMKLLSKMKFTKEADFV